MFSQTKFTEFSENQISFSEKDKSFISFCRNQKSTKSIKVIKTPDLLSHIDENGAFQFELPKFSENMQTVFVANVINVDFVNKNEYFWTGKIKTGGSILYAIKDGINVVSIQTDVSAFEIISINTEFSILRELSSLGSEIETCGTLQNELPPHLDMGCNEIDHCEATIKVLVLFNDATAASFVKRANGNTFAAQTLMSLGFEATNLTLGSSGITEKKCKFIYKRTNFSISDPKAEIKQSLATFANNSGINQLQNTNFADLVVFLDDKDYSGGTGFAEQFDGLSAATFAIVESDWLLGPRWTAVHEIGHLFGGDHSRDELDDNQCNHGHFIYAFKQNPTVMATCGVGQIRQLLYSNPEILFKDTYPTGTPDNFNASIISHAGCLIANYMSDPNCDYIDATIKGAMTLCSNNMPLSNNYNVEINNASCFDLPLSYSWTFNKTGVMNLSDPKISTSNSVTFNPTTPGVYYLFVTIESDKFIKTLVKTISVANNLSITIEGKPFTCLDDATAKLTGKVISQTCISNAFTYAWRYNKTGVFNASDPVISTKQSIDFNPGILGTYYVFLSMTSSSGATSTVNLVVKVAKCGPSHGKVASINNIKPFEVIEDYGQVQLKMESNQEKIVYQVSDISGRVLLAKQVANIPNQKIVENFELNNNGIYILTIWDGTNILNKKIIIQH